MRIEKSGKWIKARGKKKEIERLEDELLQQGHIVFIEPYDNKTYSLVAQSC